MMNSSWSGRAARCLRLGGLGASVLVASLVLAGCTTAAPADEPTPEATGIDACIEKADALVEEARVKPEFNPEVGEIDLDVTEGATYWVIAANAATAASTAIINGFIAAADIVGAKVNVTDAKGSPDAMAQGVNSAIAVDAAGIMFLAADPAVVPGPVADAGDAGIPVVVAMLGVLDAPKIDGVAVNVTYDAAQQGLWGSAYVAQQLGCEGNIVGFNPLSLSGFKVIDDSYAAGFEDLCPDTCNYDGQDIALATLATTLTPQVQNYLQLHPDTDYIAIGADSFESFVTAAKTAVGRADLPVIGGNGSGLEKAQQGTGVTASLIYPPLDYVGFLIFDTTVRAGEGDIDNVSIPQWLVDKSNWGTTIGLAALWPEFADNADLWSEAWGVD